MRTPALRPEARYVAQGFDALPGWPGAAPEAALAAFVAGCARAARIEASLVEPCARAREVASGDAAAARAFFESAFAPWALLGPEDAARGLVTGYYEPELPAARTRRGAFTVPIFGVPEDLLALDLGALAPEMKGRALRGRLEGRRVVPYWTRAEIEARADRMPAPVLAWTDDPVALFFLQIQGSGRLVFDDGARMRIGFAERNGHPYRSLGRHLVDRGELRLEEATMQGIRAWAAAHPDRLRAALDANPSYVFFRALPAAANAAPGPVGALGVPLTPRASIAVDRRFVPLGLPVYLQAADPVTAAPLERLTIAQDTGGAIRGAPRADFFWGSGESAGEKAGRMREQGRMWVLWPRGAAPRAPTP